MKRHKHLFEQIITFENLYQASRRAQKGKRFNPETARFNVNLEKELLQLRRELQAGAYVPGEYRTFYIRDPKKRLISAAPYRDRVVHHALCHIVEPIFERTFIFDSYANRVGKGTHRAIKRFQEFARQNTYVLKCDIRKYFPSIDHEILKTIIRRKIGDPHVLWLLDLIIDHSNPQEPVMNYFPGDDLFTVIERRRGLPIGNLTSQFLANVYLNPLDHFIKQILGCRCYVRYVDDFAIFGNDKVKLHEIRQAIEGFLPQLRLTLHPHKCHIHRTRQGVGFLGFRLFPSHRLLRNASLIRFRRRMRRYQKEFGHGLLSLDKLTQSIQSWLGHSCFGNTFRLRSKLIPEFSFIRFN